MTDAERAALVAYLVEQRRHYLALAKATEVLLTTLKKPVYNRSEQLTEDERTTIIGVVAHN